MAASLRKDVNALLARLQSEFGCTVVQSRRNSHWRVTRANFPAAVMVSCSPSDPRALNNIKSDLRRILDVPL